MPWYSLAIDKPEPLVRTLAGGGIMAKEEEEKGADFSAMCVGWCRLWWRAGDQGGPSGRVRLELARCWRSGSQ